MAKFFNNLSKVPNNYTRLNNVKNTICEYMCNKYVVFDLMDKYKYDKKIYNNNIILLRFYKFKNDGICKINLFTLSKYIAGVDIIKNDIEKKIKIEGYFINNKTYEKFYINNMKFKKFYNNIYGNPISEEEEIEIKRIIFGIAEDLAKMYNYNKIQFDTHQNLKFWYDNKINELGYNITNIKSKNNPYWIETIKNI